MTLKQKAEQIFRFFRLHGIIWPHADSRKGEFVELSNRRIRGQSDPEYGLEEDLQGSSFRRFVLIRINRLMYVAHQSSDRLT